MRTNYNPNSFEPHPSDKAAVTHLSQFRLRFRLTPRGRVYGVYTLSDFGDSDVESLLGLSELLELTVGTLEQSPMFTDKGMSELASHPSLQAFGCANNRMITDQSMSAIARESKIRWLSLPGCSISDAGVESLQVMGRLLTLNLRSTQITDSSCAFLAKLVQLRRLSTADTDISKPALDELAAALPLCRYID